MCSIANCQPVSSDWFDLARLVYNSARLYVPQAAFEQRPSACIIPWRTVRNDWLRRIWATDHGYAAPIKLSTTADKRFSRRLRRIVVTHPTLSLGTSKRYVSVAWTPALQALVAWRLESVLCAGNTRNCLIWRRASVKRLNQITTDGHRSV
jgi:hypothetical protein